MNTLRLALTAASLLLASSAFGQATTTYTGELTTSSPTFSRPETPFFGTPNPCTSTTSQHRYTVYSFELTGTGNFIGIEINVEALSIPLAIGIYRGPFTASAPCTNASGFYSAINPVAEITDYGPAGQYFVVVASEDDATGESTGSFTLSSPHNLTPVEWQPPSPPIVQAVPMNGLAALAFTGLAILGIGSVVSRRRTAV